MTNANNPLLQSRAAWQDISQLYPFYVALNERFKLGIGLCDELEQENENPNLDQVTIAQQWFEKVDAQVAAFHIRQLMHSGAPLPEAKLRNLLLRHLHHLEKSEQLREKLDFLLVQYYAQTAGAKVRPEAMTFEDVAQALRPVFGEVAPQKFPWSEELEKLGKELLTYKSLKDLLQGDILDRGRALKRKIQDEYFQPVALVAITKFNFALRAGFFRLMHADIEGVTLILNQLRSAGVQSVDLSHVELRAQEPLDSIKAICHEWKRRLRDDYQLGNSFQQLVLIKEACEQALQKSSTPAVVAAPPKPPAPAASKPESKPAVKNVAAAPAKPAAAVAAAAPANKTVAAPVVAKPAKAPQAPVQQTQAKAAAATSSVPKASQPPAQQKPANAAAASPAAAKATQAATQQKPANPAPGTAATAKASPQPAQQKAVSASSNGPAPAKGPQAKAPQSSLEPKPAKAAAAPVKAPQPAAQKKTENPVKAVNVDEYVEQIKAQLDVKKGDSASSIVLGETKMMLSTWEVAAFMQGGNGVSEVLQRAVTARSLMAAALDGSKKKRGSDLPGALIAARNEVARLASEIEQAKERKDVDSAVNLAATGKRLSGLITEAEGLLK